MGWPEPHLAPGKHSPRLHAVTHDDEGKTRYFESHKQGWERHLGELLDYVASDPLNEAP